MMDYEFLRFAWWILVCVLLIGFAVTDGFDMGVLNLLPFTGKKEVEKRIMINTIAPHWMVTKFGCLLPAVRCLLHGQRFMQHHSPAFSSR